jgi:hypothetical protein
MGTFYYGDARLAVVIDDRALAHMRIVVLAKLRRNESFAFSWFKGIDRNGGRSTVWIHSGLTMQFDFAGSREPEINRQWIEDLFASANRNIGMTITPEPHGHAPDGPRPPHEVAEAGEILESLVGTGI